MEHPDYYSETLQRLICHTLNAQNIWNHRLLGIPPTQKVWEIFPMEDLTILNSQNHQMSLSILQDLDLNSIINYQNSKGVAFKNTAENILSHIVNHGTYHRGQITTEIKKQGVLPIGTDYIFYNK